MKANFDFFIRKSFFAMDLIWRSEKIITFGADLIWRSEKKIKFGADFCHFVPIVPNFLRAKIYPNKVFILIIILIIYFFICRRSWLSNHKNLNIFQRYVHVWVCFTYDSTASCICNYRFQGKLFWKQSLRIL